MKRVLIAVCTYILCIFSYAGVNDVSAIPWVKDSGRDVFREKYLAGATHKAFAISETGNYGWAVGKDSDAKAAKSALFFCLKNSVRNCFLYAIDDGVVIDFFKETENQSISAIKGLKSPWLKAYAFEDNNVGVSEISSLKSGGLHEPTPITAPFAKTVNTGGLVELMLAANKPLILDVLPNDSVRKKVIPSAVWVIGAGINDDKKNDQIDALLEKFMIEFAPSKDSPIIAYCLSWECWLSYNTLYRLSKLGYKNLYWYRGGIESWNKAGLPTVDAPITAVVY